MQFTEQRKASEIVYKEIIKVLKGVERGVVSRAYRAANQLRNESIIVLSGKRSGRAYKVPGTYSERQSASTKKIAKSHNKKIKYGQLYIASAPGESPANRTGKFSLSFASAIVNL